MTLLVLLFDLATIGAAFASAWFWLKASAGRIRRVSRFEDFDHADLNRVVVSVNRTQILNARAAKATGIAAALAGMRVALGVLA